MSPPDCRRGRPWALVAVGHMAYFRLLSKPTEEWGDNGSMKKVSVERESRLLDDFFAVDEAWVRYEKFDGTMSDSVRRLVFERGDAVAALLYDTAADQMILVRQFRFPTLRKGPGWVLETAAGVVGEGETPEGTLRREVEEEAGYRLERVEHVATFFVSPGGSSERIFLYYAEVDGTSRVSNGGGVEAEGEDIEIVSIAPDQLQAMLESGEIVDAKTLVAVLWWLRQGDRS